MSKKDIRIKKYEPNWESLKRYTVPKWFKDAKLGIFIHWGVYSVPAFESEWYPRLIYQETYRSKQDRQRAKRFREYHIKNWGPLDKFGYKDFIPMFKAEKWDPKVWVDLFKKSGAHYVVSVAEHHDGFPMYDCSFTNWNAAKMGPCRDTVAELEKEVRRNGLKFGVSSHRAFNWHFYPFRDNYDTSNTKFSKLYGVPHPDEAPISYEFVLDWYARTKELVDRFSPDVLYFDFGWHREEFKPWWPRVAAYHYNHALEYGYEPILNYKNRFPDETAVYDIERGKLDNIREHYWQTDTSVSYKSWCYIKNDEFKTVTTLIHNLVDIVSKNGNLLLNIGPKADGTIPKKTANCLLGIGDWLKVNGEAIYGTRHWKIFGEGPTPVTSGQFGEKKDKALTSKDIRFTTKGKALYTICLGWPGKEAVIESLSTDSVVKKENISRITMLGSDQKLSWSQDEKGLKIKTPSKQIGKHAYTFKIVLKK